MSSLRNAVKRITHKERSQPQKRQKLGLLEKHGDYKKRANDYHSKQARLRSLREKASMRNPDEFYTAMQKSQVNRSTGKHQLLEQTRQEEIPELHPDVIKVMKHQDLAYLRTERLKAQKKIDKLSANLHFLEHSSREHKHTIFVSNSKQARQFDPSVHFDTPTELVDRTFHRPKTSQLLQQQGESVDEEGNDIRSRKRQKLSKNNNSDETLQQIQQRRQAKKLARARAGAYAELELRQAQLQRLKEAEAHLEVEHNTHKKGRKRKVRERSEDGSRPAVYKWDKRRSK